MDEACVVKLWISERSLFVFIFKPMVSGDFSYAVGFQTLSWLFHFLLRVYQLLSALIFHVIGSLTNSGFELYY